MDIENLVENLVRSARESEQRKIAEAARKRADGFRDIESIVRRVLAGVGHKTDEKRLATAIEAAELPLDRLPDTIARIGKVIRFELHCTAIVDEPVTWSGGHSPNHWKGALHNARLGAPFLPDAPVNPCLSVDRQLADAIVARVQDDKRIAAAKRTLAGEASPSSCYPDDHDFAASALSILARRAATDVQSLDSDDSGPLISAASNRFPGTELDVVVETLFSIELELAAECDENEPKSWRGNTRPSVALMRLNEIRTARPLLFENALELAAVPA